MFDILIKNGIVFDGTGQPGRRTDVAIKDGRIVEVGDLISGSAKETILADGRYVSPGFIDVQNHADSRGAILHNDRLDNFVAQGITTLAVGQCGASLAPLPNAESVKSLRKWGIFEGVNTDWRSFDEFRKKMSTRIFGSNIASLVGHATVRRVFTGDEARPLTAEEISQLALVMKRALSEGAFGISFGFQYAHEISATPEEIRALLQALKDANGIFSVHLKNQAEQFEPSVSAAVEYAKAFGLRTKISHFKIEDRANYYQMRPAMDVIEHAYQSGTNVRFDVYPYATSWHQLYTYLPRWVYEGGIEPMLKRIPDSKNIERLLHELGEQRLRLAPLIISSSPKVSKFVGKTIHEIAVTQKINPETALLRVLSANKGQAVVFDQDIAGDQVAPLLQHPLSFVSTDGNGYSLKENDETDLPHPRCFGSFPRFLRLLRDDQVDGNEIPLLPWAEGIAKITGHAAAFLGLEQRGLLQEGFFADVVIFDPKNVGDQATYTNPFARPVGIEYVITNGKIAIYENDFTGVYGGKFLSSK